MTTRAARWKGLLALVQEAVEHGSRAVERVQLETASRPFVILERLPPVAPAARVVHAAFDASVIATHAIVRTATAAAGDAVRWGIDELARAEGPADRYGPQESPCSVPSSRRT